MTDRDEPWSKATRDRWFFGFFALSTLAVGVLFLPFAYVLLFASTTVVVTWPVYETIHARVRSPTLAAITTVVLLCTVVFVPVTSVLYKAAGEGLGFAQSVAEAIAAGRLEIWVTDHLEGLNGLLEESGLGDYLPEEFSVVEAVLGPAQNALLSLGGLVTSSVPSILNSLVGIGLDVCIFLFTVVTLYVEGPHLLRFLADLSPMDDEYEERLFHVFQEFANNMVVGSFATAVLQGAVAALGYWLFGVERVLFMGLLTGMFSFVPMLGTAVVWVPLTLYIAGTKGLLSATGLAVWSVLFTGTVDNLFKPLFLRGSSEIHPLLIFLAVFGGLSTMGLPGVLLGPIIVACFLALHHIYVQNYLHLPVKAEPGPTPDA